MLKVLFSRKLRAFAFSAVAVLACLYSTASAQTTTALTVLPTTPVFDANNVVGVANDAAPGFASSSFASDGTGKTDMYFTADVLFGREITLGEILSISYYTKKGTTHVVDPADWYLAIYTKPYFNDASTPSWYGARIGSEPYFSASLNDPAGTWNQWTTYGVDNKLRFFESTAGATGANFGTYTDPDLATLLTLPSLTGSGGTTGGKPYAEQELLSLSVQTGSAWADGFTGQLDGLRIELTDGSVATINFETDSDGDGVGDGDDVCPDSDLSPTVVIDGCDSGVANVVLEDGCTIMDLIALCSAVAKNHGDFVSCVAQLTNELRKDGVITNKEKSAIQKCAAKANTP